MKNSIPFIARLRLPLRVPRFHRAAVALCSLLRRISCIRECWTWDRYCAQSYCWLRAPKASDKEQRPCRDESSSRHLLAQARIRGGFRRLQSRLPRCRTFLPGAGEFRREAVDTDRPIHLSAWSETQKGTAKRRAPLSG